MKFRLLLALILLLPRAAMSDSSALILRGVAGSPELRIDLRTFEWRMITPSMTGLTCQRSGADCSRAGAKICG